MQSQTYNLKNYISMDVLDAIIFKVIILSEWLPAFFFMIILHKSLFLAAHYNAGLCLHY